MADSLPILSKEKTIRYLQHLGLEQSTIENGELPEPTWDLLCELQSRHYRKIPFETMTQHFPESSSSLPDSDPIPYRRNLGRVDNTTDALFDKIVVRGRGSYCFELNGLFSIMLRTLGYDVTNVVAQVYQHLGKSYSDCGWEWQPLGHQCTLVSFPDEQGGKRRYHVDVGFGGPQPELPMLLGSENEMYSLQKEPLSRDGVENRETLPMGYTLYKKLPEDQLGPLYHYEDRAVLPSEYAKLNKWSCTAPEAPMVQMLFCTLPSEQGRKEIMYKGEGTEATFTQGTGDHKEQRMLHNLGELRTALREHFNIILT